uniref:Uncharacterized protein n=1 Tax=Siphoviridae sp. ctNEy24 TaxID=2825466 RepID=A0A8S5U0M1_9CAUD|nr:MAG TPA: hypothetical protein [Siphoviridae sp. ctNEy24]
MWIVPLIVQWLELPDIVLPCSHYAPEGSVGSVVVHVPIQLTSYEYLK